MTNLLENIRNYIHDQRYQTIISLLLLTLVGFFVRVYGISDWEFNNDESWHFHVAAQQSFFEVFYRNLEIDGHPILAYWIWHIIFEIFGKDEFWLRIPAAIFGTLCIPAAYLLGKNLFNEKNAGYFFAIFFTFSSLMIQQAQVVRGYSIALFFAICAINFTFNFYREKKLKYLLYYLISGVLSLFSEFASVHVFAFTSLIILYSIYKNNKKNWVFYLLWLFIHLFFIYVLLLHTGLLKNIGKLDFSSSALTFSNYNDNLIQNTNFILSFIFNYLSSISFVDSLFSTENSLYYLFSLIEIIILFYFLAFSFLKKINRAYIAIFLAYYLMMVFLHLCSLIPLDLPRRSIAFIIPLLAIIYCGFRNAVFESKVKDKANPIVIAIIFSIIFTCSFLTRDFKENPSLHSEFYHKKNQFDKIYNFVEKNYTKNDVIITDWLSFITYKPYSKTSKRFKYYDKYNIDGKIFIVENIDYRVASFDSRLNRLQKINSTLDLSQDNNIILLKIRPVTSFLKILEYEDIKNKKTTNDNYYHISSKKIHYQKYREAVQKMDMEFTDFILKNSDDYIFDRNHPREYKEIETSLYAVKVKKSVLDEALKGKKFVDMEKVLKKIRNENPLFKLVNRIKNIFRNGN